MAIECSVKPSNGKRYTHIMGRWHTYAWLVSIIFSCAILFHEYDLNRSPVEDVHNASNDYKIFSRVGHNELSLLNRSGNMSAYAAEACERGFGLFRAHNVSLESAYCVLLSRGYVGNSTDTSDEQQLNSNIKGTASRVTSTGPVVRMLGYGGDKYYRKDFDKFLADVARKVTTTGVCFVIIEDDASLPQALIEDLRRERQPLLTHAIRHTPRPGSVIMIPDFHFIRTDGFLSTNERVHKFSKKDFFRSPVVFWRGSTTSEVTDDCLQLPRVQLCLRALRDCPAWCDFKLTKLVQACNESHRPLLSKLGVLAHHVSEEHWAGRRGLLDIDGNVNAWGLIWRMRSGSVIFRVNSTFTNFYLQYMRPWEHYIPLRDDFSDLAVVTRLVTSHNHSEVELLNRIRNTGASFARSFTYYGEVSKTALILSAVWSGPP